MRTSGGPSAYFLPGPATLNPDEAVRIGVSWVSEQPGEPLIMLHAKKMLDNNRLLRDSAARLRIRVETPRSLPASDWKGGAVLAPWASKDVIRAIESADKATSFCVLGWVAGEHDTWIAAHGAVDQGLLGPGRNFLTVGSWELGIDTTSNVIYHAVYRP